MIELTVFAMKTLPDGSSTLTEGREELPDFFDVLVIDVSADPHNILEEVEEVPSAVCASLIAQAFEVKYGVDCEWLWD